MKKILAKIIAYLKEIEQWEADLIKTDKCWQNEYPQFTKVTYDNWMKLQQERNELLTKIAEVDLDEELLIEKGIQIEKERILEGLKIIKEDVQVGLCSAEEIYGGITVCNAALNLINEN